MAAETVLRTIARGGRPAAKLADVICKLTVEAGKLGELDIAQYVRPTGELVTVRRFPHVWLERLAGAIETQSLDRFDVDRLVEILLTGPR
jgi:hypothetical protein